MDFRGARVVGVTGGTSTPIEDLDAVAQRILELAGTPAARRNAAALAARRCRSPRPRPAGPRRFPRRTAPGPISGAA